MVSRDRYKRASFRVEESGCTPVGVKRQISAFRLCRRVRHFLCPVSGTLLPRGRQMSVSADGCDCPVWSWMRPGLWMIVLFISQVN